MVTVADLGLLEALGLGQTGERAFRQAVEAPRGGIELAFGGHDHGDLAGGPGQRVEIGFDEV
jgi:hypothetical protein